MEGRVPPQIPPSIIDSLKAANTPHFEAKLAHSGELSRITPLRIGLSTAHGAVSKPSRRICRFLFI